jgi:hypothetical protein
MPSSASAAAASAAPAAPPPPPASAGARPASTYAMSATSVRVRQVGHSTRRWACARAAAQHGLRRSRQSHTGSCCAHSHEPFSMFPQHGAAHTMLCPDDVSGSHVPKVPAEQSADRPGEQAQACGEHRPLCSTSRQPASASPRGREARPRQVAGQAVDERHLAAHAQLVPARQHGQLRAQRLLAHRAQLHGALARPRLACARPRAGLNRTPSLSGAPASIKNNAHTRMHVRSSC